MHQYREVEHAFINTLVRGDVSSLTWFESPNQFFEDVKRKTPTDLELCHVYYSAVNFRDVMLAYGRLPPDAIPGQVYIIITIIKSVTHRHIYLNILLNNIKKCRIRKRLL